MIDQIFNVIIDRDNEWLNIPEAEKHFNATFVGEFCLKNKQGGWANFPVSVFYQETPPKEEFSNYFGLYRCPLRGSLMITDAKIVSETPFTGVVLENGTDIIYSRYRHDCVTGANGEMIDGGRDYTRTALGKIPSRPVTLQVIKDKIEVIEDKFKSDYNEVK